MACAKPESTMSKFVHVLLVWLIGAPALAVGLPLSAQTAPPPCPDATQPRQVAELLFGRDVGGRIGVGEKAWRRFVVGELTPNFPDGLTVSDAFGQWRDPATGEIVREPTKRVEIVLRGAADDFARLDAVVQAYKREFRQRAVGLILRSACVAF